MIETTKIRQRKVVKLWLMKLRLTWTTKVRPAISSHTNMFDTEFFVANTVSDCSQSDSKKNRKKREVAKMWLMTL